MSFINQNRHMGWHKSTKRWETGWFKINFSYQKQIKFNRGPKELIRYLDADWAGDKNNRMSIHGILIFYGDNVVNGSIILQEGKVMWQCQQPKQNLLLRLLVTQVIYFEGIVTEFGV